MKLDIRAIKARSALLAEENRVPARTLVLWYCGVLAALTLGSGGLNLYLDNQINTTGGLDGIGLRSIFQTIQQILSYVNQFFEPFLSAGFLCAMIAMVRGNRPQPLDLTRGFRKAFHIMVFVAFEGLAVMLLLIAAVNLSSIIFLLSPLGADFTENVAPILVDPNVLTPEGFLNEELITLAELMRSILPYLVITAVVFLPMLAVMYYGFRPAMYLLVTRPIGGVAAHFLSLRLMRGRKWQMFRLDLSFWWYHLLGALCYAVAVLPACLEMLGIGLPMDETAVYFAAPAVHCLLFTLLCLWKKTRVDAAYVLAYEAIAAPEAEETAE